MSPKAIVIIVVMASWGLSAVILDLTRFSKARTNNHDRASFFLLNAVMFLGIGGGIYVYENGLYLGIGSFNWGRPYLYCLGLLLFVSGIVIRWAAILTLRKQFTVNVSIVTNHELIERGIYKHVRHPAYLGGSLAYVGFGLALQNWISIVVIFVPIQLSYIYRIAVEEKVLRDHFGAAYVEYAKRTKRFIPKVF